MSPYQYYLELKIHRARQMLRETALTVKEIARKLGFESPFHSHFAVFLAGGAGGATEIGLIASPALSGSGGNLAWGSV